MSNCVVYMEFSAYTHVCAVCCVRVNEWMSECAPLQSKMIESIYIYTMHDTRCTMCIVIFMCVYDCDCDCVWWCQCGFVAIWQAIKFRNNMWVCAYVCYVRTHRKCWFFALYRSCGANDIIAVFIVLSFIILTREKRKREKNGSSRAILKGKTN